LATEIGKIKLSLYRSKLAQWHQVFEAARIFRHWEQEGGKVSKLHRLQEIKHF
jgi:hypothetical protein